MGDFRDDEERHAEWIAEGGPDEDDDDEEVGFEEDSIPEMDIFVVRIRLGNERMSSPTDISEALMRVSSQVQWSDYSPGGKQILDANGNTVGSWAIYERSHEVAMADTAKGEK